MEKIKPDVEDWPNWRWHEAWDYFEDASVEEIDAYLDAGADVTDALHYTARFNRRAGAVTYLLERGAGLNAKDPNCKTPLHIALRHNPKNFAIDELLKAGADETSVLESGDKVIIFRLALRNYRQQHPMEEAHERRGLEQD